VGVIYFAAASDGRIKIGTTRRDVSDRLKQIGQDFAEPLALLGSIDGDHRFERAVHTYLREHRIAGEWFRDCAAVRRVVRNIVLGGGGAIGFHAPPKMPPARSRSTAVKPTQTPDLDLFVRGAKLVFGSDAVAELAHIGEVSVAVAETWLDGCTVPPRAVRMALVGVIASRCDFYDRRAA
jgi:hypothetical protein